MIKRLFFNGFHFVTANVAPNNDFDTMLYTELLNATHYKIRFSTDYDSHTINFYQVVAVFYCE